MSEVTEERELRGDNPFYLGRKFANPISQPRYSSGGVESDDERVNAFFRGDFHIAEAVRWLLFAPRLFGSRNFSISEAAAAAPVINSVIRVQPPKLLKCIEDIGMCL